MQLVILINFMLKTHKIAATIKHLAIRKRTTNNNSNKLI